MAERCEQCGFDGAAYDDRALLDAMRDLGPRWHMLMLSAGGELRTRPAPDVWSALEYAAHSRDVTALHAWGVEQALTGTEPQFGALADDLVDSAAASYGEADPLEVEAALASYADELAALADAAGPRNWSRGLTLGDNRMDVRALLEHALHDSTHHLQDVARGLAELRGRAG
jgi:hypothetical protein